MVDRPRKVIRYMGTTHIHPEIIFHNVQTHTNAYQHKPYNPHPQNSHKPPFINIHEKKSYSLFSTQNDHHVSEISYPYTPPTTPIFLSCIKIACTSVRHV